MHTLTRKTLATLAIESIKEYITSNELMPGDKLPPEREFCRMLNVSNRVVREALKSLEALGVIRIRVGDGLYVSEFDCTKLVENFAFSIRQNTRDMHHLGQARYALEIAALECLGEHLDDSMIDVLERIVEKMAAARSIKENIAADSEFHKAIIGLTRNPMLIEFCGLIDDFFDAIMNMAADSAMETDSALHMEIVNALRSRDIERARRLIREHSRYDRM